MGFQFFGAATRADWLEAFQSVRRGAELQYYLVDFYPEPSVRALSLEEIEHLDASPTGILIGGNFYYALLPEQSLTTEKLNMYDGTVKYVIDRYSQPSTFIFRPGGLYDSQYFVISEMSSVYDKDGSVDVAKRVMSYARRHWHRGNGYWIGPDCYDRYNGSRIFTEDYRQHATSPPITPKQMISLPAPKGRPRRVVSVAPTSPQAEGDSSDS